MGPNRKPSLPSLEPFLEKVDAFLALAATSESAQVRVPGDGPRVELLNDIDRDPATCEY
jgi:hypothetical protein